MEARDPIVDEVRGAGEAYFAQFKFDLKAICKDLERRSKRRRIKTISRSPRKPVAILSRPSRKAG